MVNGSWNSKSMAKFFALSQIGMEMVSPLVLGLILDYYLGSGPWLSVAGAFFGFVGGMIHLVRLLNQPDDPGSTEQRESKP